MRGLLLLLFITLVVHTILAADSSNRSKRNSLSFSYQVLKTFTDTRSEKSGTDASTLTRVKSKIGHCFLLSLIRS